MYTHWTLPDFFFYIISHNICLCFVTYNEYGIGGYVWSTQCAKFNMAVRNRVMTFKRRTKAGCRSRQVFLMVEKWPYELLNSLELHHEMWVSCRRVALVMPAPGVVQLPCWCYWLLGICNYEAGVAFILGVFMMQGFFFKLLGELDAWFFQSAEIVFRGTLWVLRATV